MPILTLTRYERLGSSSRVRFYQYFPHLKANGFEIINAPFFGDEYVRSLYSGRKTPFYVILRAYIDRLASLIHHRSIDLLWVEKELLPWFPFEVESIFHTSKTPRVVDYDDAVFHRYDLHPNLLLRTLLGKKIDRIMSRSNLVIAGNEYIADRARMAGAPRVETLPSIVDVDRYTVKQLEADLVFKIGWIGSPVTSQYLNLIHAVISELNKESQVRLVLVGAGNSSLHPEIPTEVLPWNEELERTVNQKFDVGIMPLVDGPFERGKCGYKLIQYMAGGIPVVASPVGVNQQIVEPGINGYLANSTDEWLDALRTLRDDPQRRHRMGMAGRQKAETHYNLRVTAPRLLELLKSAARS
jgi:glycosyltransferase involved in cell wall biosynthesis